ncbi:sigma-70 family RNA polymerase sigma factor [Pseudomonas sp. NPDC090233]|uniref:sigma-70 family RNA polymerase sigma factor n=1 Tax=Pseudomonas sp. NPDC090233 TaxID=3364479 RepID=UPI00383B366F
MEHYYRELVSFLCTRLGSRQAAEDVAHDAYLRVLERTDSQHIEHPRAFLYRTALNLVVDRHRRNRVRQTEQLDGLEVDASCSGQELQQAFQLDQRLTLMQRALGELSPVCRDSFLLRKLDGLSHQQIAEQLSISRSLVEKHIVNAMKHCRVRMREWES